MDRRNFLLGGLAALVALSTPKLVDNGIEMVARVEAKEFPVYDDIGKYYDSGTPSDVMPGARLCPLGGRMNAKAFLYKPGEWVEHYFDNPKYSSDLQSIFRELDDQKITIHSPEHEGETIVFDFDKFHEFNIKKKKSDNGVGLWYDEFMGFGGSEGHIFIPIPIDTIDSIKKLYK